MLIYNRCWKRLCCLIFGTCDIFQDSWTFQDFILRNKKVKKNSVYSKYKLLQYALIFKMLRSVNFFYKYLFRKDVLNGQKLILKTSC